MKTTTRAQKMNCKKCGSNRLRRIKKTFIQKLLNRIICAKNIELRVYKCEICKWQGMLKINLKKEEAVITKTNHPWRDMWVF